jgi:hypothetical protein
MNPRLVKASIYQNGTCIQEEVWQYAGEGNPNTNMIYDDSYNSYRSSSERLKAKCWICMKELNVSQYTDWESSGKKYKCEMECCGRKETVSLTEEQIKTVNNDGYWLAFMQ